MTRILIADDHHVIRMGLRILLEQHGYIVVGEVSSGLDVARACRDLQPDIVILDIDLPGMDGFEVLRRLNTHDFSVKVLIFSAMPTDGYSIRCSRLGAVGYVSKADDINELISAINMVIKGYTMFPIVSSSRVNKIKELESEQDLIDSLSVRELAVLKYLSRGYRVTQISQELQLSDKTISTYKARLLTKLGFDNIADLIDFARNNKIN